jgi:hypothetical protein
LSRAVISSFTQPAAARSLKLLSALYDSQAQTIELTFNQPCLADLILDEEFTFTSGTLVGGNSEVGPLSGSVLTLPVQTFGSPAGPGLLAYNATTRISSQGGTLRSFSNFPIAIN